MVRDDDAMVPAALPDKRLYLIDVHGVELHPFRNNSHVSTRDTAETFYRYQPVTYEGNSPRKPLVSA